MSMDGIGGRFISHAVAGSLTIAVPAMVLTGICRLIQQVGLRAIQKTPAPPEPVHALSAHAECVVEPSPAGSVKQLFAAGAAGIGVSHTVPRAIRGISSSVGLDSVSIRIGTIAGTAVGAIAVLYALRQGRLPSLFLTTASATVTAGVTSGTVAVLRGEKDELGLRSNRIREATDRLFRGNDSEDGAARFEFSIRPRW